MDKTIKDNKKINYLRIYKRVLNNYFGFAPVSAAFSLVNYIIGGLFPAFTALALVSLFEEAYNIEKGDGTTGKLLFWGIVYLIAYVINNILLFIAGLVLELGADKRNVQYRYLMCEKLARMKLIDFEDAKIRDMQQRAEECLYTGRMNGIIRDSFGMVIISALNVVTVSLVLAQYSLFFIPLCVISVLPYCIARFVRGKEFYYIKRKIVKKSRRLGYLWGLFTDRRSVKELRALGADDYVFDKWAECRDAVQGELWEQNRKDAVSLLFCDALRIIGYGVCIALALYLTLKGTVNVGVFGACIAAFLTLQSATRGILTLGGELPRELAFAGDYFDYIDLPEENQGEDEKGSVPYTKLRDTINLRGVSFKYPNNAKYAVENVSFDIKKGEKVAILGENGSGKTTLSKLLLGLYPCTDGEVFYDGVDVEKLEKKSFYKTVSAVAQNFTQYKFSLRENIAISDISKINDDKEITKALEDAGLSELLDRVGLDSELSTAFGGTEVSGGQWQKIAIARGLFKKSGLIVLDEPTSALDPLIETEILTKFIEIIKDKTAVIISHRVGLCRLVDKIVVMKDGRIAEIGSHEELLAKGEEGEYFQLFTAQEKWYR